MASFTLYNSVHDPISQSMMLLLKAKKIPHETVEVQTRGEIVGLQNGKGRAKSFLEALNFLRTETTLQENDGEKLEKIMQYFSQNIEPLFYRTVLTGNPREGLDLFFEAISYLENTLDESPGSFFGGKEPGAIDYGLYPWIEKIGPWFPRTERHECVKLQTWVRKMSRLPLVVELMPDTDKETLNAYKNTLSKELLCQFEQKC